MYNILVPIPVSYINNTLNLLNISEPTEQLLSEWELSSIFFTVLQSVDNLELLEFMDALIQHYINDSNYGLPWNDLYDELLTFLTELRELGLIWLNTIINVSVMYEYEFVYYNDQYVGIMVS